MNIDLLQDAMCTFFSTPAALERVRMMKKAETQAEGWWKIETMLMLERLHHAGKINRWEHGKATGVGRQKINLVVDEAAIQLRTVLYGRQKGQTWRLPAYDYFILPDVEKLAELKTRWVNYKHFYVVVFAVASPPTADWDTLLGKLADKTDSCTVTLDRVDDIGDGSLTIGWLRVQ